MQNSAALQSSVLFKDLSGEDLEKALRFYKAANASHKKGEYLLHEGDSINRFGLVLSGMVQVFMDDMNGDRTIMANVSAGSTFGESLCFLETRYAGIYIIAASDCRLLWLSTDKLRERSAGDDFSCLMKIRFMSLLAQRALTMNDRIQTLSKRTLRAKLYTYFALCRRHFRSSFFELDMDRNDMAAYLGADRSALSRELSKMRSEGLIDYTKNRFTLLLISHDTADNESY